MATNPCGYRPFSVGHFVKTSTRPAERAKKKRHLNVGSVGLRGWLLPTLADVSLTARQLVLRVPSHFTILVGEEGKSHLSDVYGAPFSGLRQMDFHCSGAGTRRGRGERLSVGAISPRGGRLRFGIDGLKLRLAADRQTGRLGTPRSQACLDRSSPVSGCCGLMLSGGGWRIVPHSRGGGVLQRRHAADC